VESLVGILVGGGGGKEKLINNKKILFEIY
jgi:hypothetical protein